MHFKNEDCLPLHPPAASPSLGGLPDAQHLLLYLLISLRLLDSEHLEGRENIFSISASPGSKRVPGLH